MNKADAIAALATAPGRAAIGIVRVSGTDLEQLVCGIAGRALPPRQATFTDFLGGDGTILDSGIALYFPAPHSYTGEDVLELQGHGGPAVLGMVLQRCVALGARLAHPGEFSQRAYLNGKLDLAQAESVADLIEASTEAAAFAALRSLKGEFSAAVQQVGSDITDLRIFLEAGIDFPEDTNHENDDATLRTRVKQLRAEVVRIAKLAAAGSRLRNGVHAVILGQPNVGKSTLLNCLAREDIAIVTPIPGTTRDTVGVDIAVRGVPIHLTDTAGLRKTDDLVELEGISRTWRTAEASQVALLVFDARVGRTQADDEILARLPSSTWKLAVANKIDMAERPPGVLIRDGLVEVAVSAKSGAGIDLLCQSLVDVIGGIATQEGAFMARERHLEALRSATIHLEAGLLTNQAEVLAEELRLARVALGAIIGDLVPDDLLGQIFSRFCIGK